MADRFDEMAREVVEQFSWTSNVMRGGRLVGQQHVVADAIAAKLRFVAEGWLPVDDAAKDGKEWLVCNSRGHRRVACWTHWKGVGGKMTWLWADGDRKLTDITHYRPLPAPPTERKD